MPFRLAMTGFLAALLAACSGSPPANPGSLASGLPPCPGSPNCVHTGDGVPDGTAPLLLAPGVDRPEASTLEAALTALPRTRVVAREGGEGGGVYLRAESTSRIFRFVDDVEVLWRPGDPSITVRSASRLGESDLGVNARRVEALRDELSRAGLVR